MDQLRHQARGTGGERGGEGKRGGGSRTPDRRSFGSTQKAMTATIRGAKMDSPFIFLAATNTLEKLEKIPPAFWAKVGLAVAGVIIVVIVLRKLFSINKFVLFGAIFIGGGIYFFNMV